MVALKADLVKAKDMQARNKERNAIVQELKKCGPSTVEDLAKTTGLDPNALLKHLIAMRQFGKVAINGQNNKQLVYSLIEDR